MSELMPAVISILSLDEIARDPQKLDGLDAAALAALALRVNAAAGAIAARLALNLANGASPTPAADAGEDRMLTIDEAAVALRRSRAWLYRNAGTLPFIRRISRKSLLCSQKDMQRWLDRCRRP